MNAQSLLCLTFLYAAICPATTFAAQKPVGPIPPVKPVAPVPPRDNSAQSYEAILAELLKADADEKLWSSIDAKRKAELLGRVDALRESIQRPVGPVAPKPKPPQPAPPKPRRNQPTEDDFEGALYSLRTALAESRKSEPAMNLPAEVSRDLQQLVEQLRNGALR